jgi:release factor glutamine methyltransferase
VSAALPASRAAALAHLRAALREAGLPGADREARALLLAALGLAPVDLVRDPEAPLGPDQHERLARWLARRLAGEPLGRIAGRREFWGLDFTLSPATLEPRPDSETLVEAALDRLDATGRRDAPLRILDIGTGTGCLLAALLHECSAAFGIGVDLSAQAAATARANIDGLGLGSRAAILVTRWSDALAGAFDIVISNPPYIPVADIAGLDIGVRDHDPMLALDGGADGLDAYRAIIARLPRLLAPDGFAVLELGIGQTRDVAALGSAAGFVVRDLRADLGGIDRAMILSRP